VLHYYFGIRPVLHSKRCTECGHCLSACPVDAIDIRERQIVAKRCMPVRCLACIPACPENAISVHGRNVDPGLIETQNR
jgi:ferredoxin